ncbi:MAG: hypothetical protein FRX49_13150 [Trebouxia sp. A1-2]|nr:MAG: hypothetical protein FRX49_13150 [Trebouxia sp. A1-2]
MPSKYQDYRCWGCVPKAVARPDWGIGCVLQHSLHGHLQVAVLKDTTNAPQHTQAKGINKAGAQPEPKTDVADSTLLRKNPSWAITKKTAGT